ncbi:uncharacterized protein LOC115317528, partial [Ixodes scapularis]|uniref:uncharacterized protein LOC115317528 n=1 Tax=Ixodes scapularis TaxID=6945 RepID=UPI001A9DCDEE
RNEIRELRTDIREMKSGMDFINAEFEGINRKLESGAAADNELKKENEELKARCLALEKEMKTSQMSIVHCEQHSRAYNLEIKGVPVIANENLNETLRQLGEAIGERIDTADVEICHRVRTRERGKQNIVDRVLAKARSKRITNEDLGLSADSPVFINEHLCPTLKKLLGKTIAKKRDAGWKFAWVRNGKILARKSETTDFVSIEHEGDLLKIC